MSYFFHDQTLIYSNFNQFLKYPFPYTNILYNVAFSTPIQCRPPSPSMSPVAYMRQSQIVGNPMSSQLNIGRSPQRSNPMSSQINIGRSPQRNNPMSSQRSIGRSPKDVCFFVLSRMFLLKQTFSRK